MRSFSDLKFERVYIIKHIITILIFLTCASMTAMDYAQTRSILEKETGLHTVRGPISSSINFNTIDNQITGHHGITSGTGGTLVHDASATTVESYLHYASDFKFISRFNLDRPINVRVNIVNIRCLRLLHKIEHGTTDYSKAGKRLYNSTAANKPDATVPQPQIIVYDSLETGTFNTGIMCINHGRLKTNSSSFFTENAAEEFFADDVMKVNSMKAVDMGKNKPFELSFMAEAMILNTVNIEVQKSLNTERKLLAARLSYFPSGQT